MTNRERALNILRLYRLTACPPSISVTGASCSTNGRHKENNSGELTKCRTAMHMTGA